MPRWMAVGKTARPWDAEKFTSELKATHNWRADARTSITSVFDLSGGRLAVECHGVNKSDFEAWLQKKGITVEGQIQPIVRMAHVGSIWEFETS